MAFRAGRELLRLAWPDESLHTDNKSILAAASSGGCIVFWAWGRGDGGNLTLKEGLRKLEILASLVEEFGNRHWPVHIPAGLLIAPHETEKAA